MLMVELTVALLCVSSDNSVCYNQYRIFMKTLNGLLAALSLLGEAPGISVYPLCALLGKSRFRDQIATFSHRPPLLLMPNFLPNTRILNEIDQVS